MSCGCWGDWPHAVVHNCYPAYCLSTAHERIKTLFYAWKNGFLVFLPLSYRCIILSLFILFHLFALPRVSLLMPRGEFKEHKATDFCWEFPCYAEYVTWSDTVWSPRLFSPCVPGDHLKPVAFISRSQRLFRWCTALTGALTWWRTEGEGGDHWKLDLAWINGPSD